MLFCSIHTKYMVINLTETQPCMDFKNLIHNIYVPAKNKEIKTLLVHINIEVGFICFLPKKILNFDFGHVIVSPLSMALF
jgi:hypothetical protein